MRRNHVHTGFCYERVLVCMLIKANNYNLKKKYLHFIGSFQRWVVDWLWRVSALQAGLIIEIFEHSTGLGLNFASYLKCKLFNIFDFFSEDFFLFSYLFEEIFSRWWIHRATTILAKFGWFLDLLTCWLQLGLGRENAAKSPRRCQDV